MDNKKIQIYSHFTPNVNCHKGETRQVYILGLGLGLKQHRTTILNHHARRHNKSHH